jgi:LPXTG-site transpeptidase (sortase) family protein
MISHHFRHVRSSEYVRILFLRTLGNFLIFSSLFMIGKTFYQPLKAEVRYQIDKSINKKYIVADSKNAVNVPVETTIQKGALAKALNLKELEVLVPEDPEFSVIIPAIGANARVINDVDAANEEDYLQALQKGVAHAQGTAFPGENGHVFLFAHSTDYIWNVGTYNAVFYLLYKVEQGDEIHLFYKGKRHTYKVLDKKIVDPSQVEYLTRKTNKEFLTLQTCWPPGTALQRLLVFATPVE